MDRQSHLVEAPLTRESRDEFFNCYPVVSCTLTAMCGHCAGPIGLNEKGWAHYLGKEERVCPHPHRADLIRGATVPSCPDDLDKLVWRSVPRSRFFSERGTIEVPMSHFPCKYNKEAKLYALAFAHSLARGPEDINGDGCDCTRVLLHYFKTGVKNDVLERYYPRNVVVDPGHCDNDTVIDHTCPTVDRPVGMVKNAFVGREIGLKLYASVLSTSSCFPKLRLLSDCLALAEGSDIVGVFTCNYRVNNSWRGSGYAWIWKLRDVLYQRWYFLVSNRICTKSTDSPACARLGGLWCCNNSPDLKWTCKAIHEFSPFTFDEALSVGAYLRMACCTCCCSI